MLLSAHNDKFVKTNCAFIYIYRYIHVCHVLIVAMCRWNKVVLVCSVSVTHISCNHDIMGQNPARDRCPMFLLLAVSSFLPLFSIFCVISNVENESHIFLLEGSFPLVCEDRTSTVTSQGTRTLLTEFHSACKGGVQFFRLSS